MKYLKLIRFQNLAMLALMQLVVLYGFLKLQNIPLALAIWQYYLLLISTVCIAAGGYIINNIMDQDADLENNPNNVVVGKELLKDLPIIYMLFLPLSGLELVFIYQESLCVPIL